MSFSGFCDRCGQFCDRLRNYRDCLCAPCELGMHSLAAVFDQRWSRPMTASEVQLARQWAIIEQGPPKREMRRCAS